MLTPQTKRLILIIGLVTVNIFGLIAVAATLTAYAYEGLTLPRTYVAGVSLGGERYSEAYEKLTVLGRQLEETPLTFRLESAATQLPLKDLGVAMDLQHTNARINRSANQWEWTRPSYWQAFFSRKALAFSYQADLTVVTARIGQEFQVQALPTNAEVTVENDQLTVKPASIGRTITAPPLRSGLDQLTLSGRARPIILSTADQLPTISTDQAEETKKELDSVLKPINLHWENQKFVLSIADQYQLLSFQPDSDRLTWLVDRPKLQTFLDGRVGKKLNLKMIERTVMADSGEVTAQGRDGRSVELDQLTDQVSRTITEQVDTGQTPLEIPIKTIPLTEKKIYPDYVPGLFPGLYLDISLAKQTLYIIEGSQRKASYLVSTGRRGNPTPKGLFYIKNKIPLARSRLYPSLWMRKWNALAKNPDGSGYEGYGIHDLPCFDKDCKSVEGAGHLGRPVSHGCVRLSPEGAIYVYDNIPVGTPVNIH